MTRVRLSLPPGYAPVPGVDRAAPTSARSRDGDPNHPDVVLDALAATREARGVVTAGVLALDASTTAWLTVAVTALAGTPPGAGRIVNGIVDVLRTRYPAVDVRPVVLPAGPAVRAEQRGRLDLPGGRVEVTDVRHLVPLPGGREVVTLVLQAGDADPVLLGETADRAARGLRLEDGAP